jgi:mono/diheme cytochrome c family protein
MKIGRWSIVDGRWSQVYYHGLLTIAYGLVLISCSTKDPKFLQYYAQGEKLYVKHCSNCHQKSGMGLGSLYPPIAKSDFIQNNLNETLCLMKYGKQGAISVNTIEYNKPMPGIPGLTDLEVAEIATFIYNTWGAEKGLIDVSKVAPIIQSCQR